MCGRSRGRGSGRCHRSAVRRSRCRGFGPCLVAAWAGAARHAGRPLGLRRFGFGFGFGFGVGGRAVLAGRRGLRRVVFGVVVVRLSRWLRRLMGMHRDWDVWWP